MKQELEKYIDSLFSDVEKSKLSDDLRDEIRADMESSYDDCIKSGMSPAAAYANAIRSLGDVDMLIEEVKQKALTLRPEEGFQIEYFTGEKSRAADFDTTFDKLFGFITPNNHKVLYGAITSILWIVTTIIYLFISFITGWWHLTWLIFLVSAIADILLDLVFFLGKMRFKPYSEKNEKRIIRRINGALSGILWLGTVIAYMLFSFIFGAWSISWIIFLFAAVIEVILTTIVKLIRI